LDDRSDLAMPTAPDRRRLPRCRPALNALGVWLGGLVACLGGDLPAPLEESKRPGSPWPSAIILEPPANRDALLQKLRRPDLLIWDDDGFERGLLGRVAPSGAPAGSGLVESVSVEVHPAEAKGRLRVRYRITLDGDDRIKVPIALDGLILGKVTEAGRDLAVSPVGETRAWAVELAGRGDHLVEVETAVAVRSIAAGKTLELAIPLAASTRVELVAPRPLGSARAGVDEPLILDSDGGSRAEAHLGPRGRLELTWRERDLPGETRPAILAARAEVAIKLGPGAIETRETWSITALRGAARQVVIGLDPAEEVVDLEVDRRPVAVDRRRVDRADFDDLTIPLTEPIGALGSTSSPKTLTILLATKRPSPPDKSGAPSRLTFRGHPIVDARSQTGLIGVERSDALLIAPVEGRAIRRVDPRTELPDTFGNRPEGRLGFEFAEQPFDLALEVQPAAPRFEVNARSTVVLKGDQAEVVTAIVGRVWQGRLFEAKVEVPPGLVYEPTDPATEGATIRSTPKWSRPDDPAPGSTSGVETLVATFPRPLGPGDNFTITLRGADRVPGEGVAAVGLFRPLGGSPASTEVALVSGRDRRGDLIEGSSRFARLDANKPPARWNWPTGFDPKLGAAPTWLRAECDEGSVPIRIKSRPKAIQHRSSLTVAVDRQGADVVDEIVGDVANGSTSTLEVALPPEVNDRWVAESGEGLEREPMAIDPATGRRRYRLKLPEPLDTFQIRVRYRIDFIPRVSDPTARDFRLQVQPTRVLGARSTGQTVRLLSDPDVAIVAEAPGWTTLPGGSRGPSDSIQQIRRSLEHLGESAPPAIEVSATLAKLADLPTLVASRLWLRSTEWPGGRLATSAQYRLEVHPRSVVIRLPEGSRWVRGVAGTSEITSSDVERLDPNAYRIALPPAVGSGPVPLRVDSVIDQPPSDGTWPAPELVGGVVQQSAWELSLLGTRAGVGVPDGWTDENLWYRDGLLWKRKPRRAEADLARWLLADGLPRPSENAGSRSGREPDPPVAPVEGDGWSGDFDAGRHSYLFSRPGPPTPLHFATHARPTLLLVCSGPVLLVGLLILARRPPPRWVAGGLLALGFGFVAAVEPNTALLITESSSLGFALLGIAAVIHATLERRGRSSNATESAVVLASRPQSSPPTPSLAVSPSNEMTVIRLESGRAGGSTSEYPSRLLGDDRPSLESEAP